MEKTGFLKKKAGLSPAHLLPGESVYMIKRKHWFVLIGPISFLVISVILLSFIIITAKILFSINAIVFFFLLSSLVLISMGLGIKLIIDWLFNFYIITSHKISEIKINPLFGDSISEILLKQVRCTEIDVLNYGVINQLLNKGDVHITFDRPTHRDEFVLSDISNPRTVGMHLSDRLIQTQLPSQEAWYKDLDQKNIYRYADETMQL